MRELNDRNGVETQVFDLFTEKDTLHVPSYHEKNLHYYKLQSKQIVFFAGDTDMSR